MLRGTSEDLNDLRAEIYEENSTIQSYPTLPNNSIQSNGVIINNTSPVVFQASWKDLPVYQKSFTKRGDLEWPSSIHANDDDLEKTLVLTTRHGKYYRREFSVKLGERYYIYYQEDDIFCRRFYKVL